MVNLDSFLTILAKTRGLQVAGLLLSIIVLGSLRTDLSVDVLGDVHWRHALAASFMGCAGFASILFGPPVADIVEDLFRRRRLLCRLRKMTRDERSMLLKYLKVEQRALAWRLDDGTAEVLALDGVLVRGTGVNKLSYTCPYFITDEALDFIRTQAPEESS